MPTSFENKTLILSEFWLQYRDDTDFVEIFKLCGLGLALAHAIDNGIVGNTDLAANLIDEAFDLLLFGLGIVDEGFESIEEMIYES
jgi:hypothetical protein